MFSNVGFRSLSRCGRNLFLTRLNVAISEGSYWGMSKIAKWGGAKKGRSDLSSYYMSFLAPHHMMEISPNPKALSTNTY